MTDWENYESGPFCRHWYDPSDCDTCRAGCAACGHSGLEHEFASPGVCAKDGCPCEQWADKAESPVGAVPPPAVPQFLTYTLMENLATSIASAVLSVNGEVREVAAFQEVRQIALALLKPHVHEPAPAVPRQEKP